MARRTLALSLLFSAAVLAWAAVAAAPALALEDGGSARVVEVVDGDTVVLDDGGRVRLVGIQAPKLPLGRPDFQAWPLAEEAKAALERLAGGKTVVLRHGGRRLDRHGRRLAHLYLEDGTWVQGALLSEGLARVYTWPDNRGLGAMMLALEAGARHKRRGIWADAFYRVRKAEDAMRDLDTFQLVEGRIEAAARVRGRTFLNFGPDWRTDFTVEIEAADLPAFREAGTDLAALQGRRVRVRGWIKSWNGPMIRVTHPEQIELAP